MATINYPALTATELALLSTSEFNARVTAFLQYVSEQEGMTIGDVITNSERVANETACPDTFIQEDGVTPNEGKIGCNL